MSKRLICFPSIRIGQVIKKKEVPQFKLAKVRTQNMRLDKNILMYFPSKRDKWCVDKHDTRIGDIVVIKNTDERYSREVFTQIDSIMYKVGETVDPVTGRRCRGTDFIDTGLPNDKTAQSMNSESKHQTESSVNQLKDSQPVKETEL